VGASPCAPKPTANIEKKIAHMLGEGNCAPERLRFTDKKISFFVLARSVTKTLAPREGESLNQLLSFL
jgi:hypothetical protein